MIRGVLLFLLLMAVIGLLGKLGRPKVTRRKPGTAVESARRCPRCGTYLVGDATCDCAETRDR